MFVDRKSLFLSQTRHICLLIWVRLGAFAYWSESDSAHLLTGQSQTRRICLLIWVRLGVFAYWSESDSAHLLTDLSQTQHICLLTWVRLGTFAYWSESDSAHLRTDLSQTRRICLLIWVRLDTLVYVLSQTRLSKKNAKFQSECLPTIEPIRKTGDCILEICCDTVMLYSPIIIISQGGFI